MYAVVFILLLRFHMLVALKLSLNQSSEVDCKANVYRYVLTKTHLQSEDHAHLF